MRKFPFFGYQPPPGGGSSPSSTTSAVSGMSQTQKTAVVAVLIATIVAALIGVSLVVNNVSSTQPITPYWQIYKDPAFATNSLYDAKAPNGTICKSSSNQASVFSSVFATNPSHVVVEAMNCSGDDLAVPSKTWLDCDLAVTNLTFTSIGNGAKITGGDFTAQFGGYEGGAYSILTNGTYSLTIQTNVFNMAMLPDGTIWYANHNLSTTFNSGSTALKNTGGLLMFADSAYTVPSTLYLYCGESAESPQLISGAVVSANVLTLANGANCNMFDIEPYVSGSFSHHGGIEQLSMDGNKAHQTAYSNLIYIIGQISDTSFVDDSIWGGYSNGICFQGTSTGNEYFAKITQCWIEDNGGDGIQLDQSGTGMANVEISDNYGITLNGGCGINGTAATFITVANNNPIKQNGLYGVLTNGNQVTLLGNDIYQNSQASSGTYAEVDLGWGANLELTGNTLGWVSSEIASYALQANGGSYLIVTGGMMYPGLSGVYTGSHEATESFTGIGGFVTQESGTVTISSGSTAALVFGTAMAGTPLITLTPDFSTTTGFYPSSISNTGFTANGAIGTYTYMATYQP